MTLERTEDLTIFKTLPGNREINKSLFKKLEKSILESNLLSTNPIIVNSEMEVIDGQHRLEVARKHNLEVTYLVDQDGDLEHVWAHNTVRNNWKPTDYLDSYTKAGKENYIKLGKFVSRYDIPITQAISILTGFAGSKGDKAWLDFRKGHLIITNWGHGVRIAEQLKLLEKYVDRSILRSEKFNQALVFANRNKDFNMAKLVKKMKVFKTTFQKDITTKGYLRQMEDIYNFKCHYTNRIRFNTERLPGKIKYAPSY